MTPIEVILSIARRLEALGVRYAIGGSLASAIHGVARATMDIDLVADLAQEHVAPLVEALGGAYYADEAMIRDAISRQSSFNLLHMETLLKIDVFVAKASRFHAAELDRRQSIRPAATEPEAAYFVSAEDIVLAKLAWYRQGGEVSERQWRDVQGVLTVQRGRLDLGYLRDMAATLKVLDLVDRALSEAEAGA